MFVPRSLAEDEAHEGMKAARSSELSAIRAEIRTLQRRSDSLESRREVRLKQEVESYLLKVDAQGAPTGQGGLQGVTISASLTAVGLATLSADPNNTHAVRGDVDLDFDFEVTDNLDLFIYLTANSNNDGSFPDAFGERDGLSGSSSKSPGLSGTPPPFPSVFAGTLSGAFDGIGVDGTVSPDPGSITVREAGIRWSVPVAERTLHVILGKLDPRDRFAQNKFANDENTQFLNNVFDDPPAISWPNNASGPTIYGIQGWMEFGARSQYRADAGYFNIPGQFFNNGFFLFQFSWTGELRGREINVRIYAQVDTSMRDTSAGFGVSADWWATDNIGVFVRATVRDNQSSGEGETNFVESDWQGGAVFKGLLGSRPDDTLGVAVGFIKGPIRAGIPGATENSELVIEIYYNYVLEEGKMTITPLVQFIQDPGGGSFRDPDSLVILGVRIHVPF